MLTRSISLILLAFFLTNCASFDETATSAPIKTHSPINTTGHAHIPISEPFTRVVIHGNIDVTLHTGESKSSVVLSGDTLSFPEVKTSIHNGLLRITVGKGYPHFGRIHADIRTRFLSSFDYKGNGTVIAPHLKSGRLDLAINNEGKTLIKGHIALHRLLLAGTGYTQIDGITSHASQIQVTGKTHAQLSGVIDVTSLNLAGDSSISLYWVKSNVLKIRAKDKAFVQIAGVVHTLDAVLKDKAHFNGRYLRGTHVFVKTFDHSIADICVIKTQHTLASGASNIYFHNLPKMKADFMAMNGSVLDMHEWGTPEQQEYTPYNR